MTSEDSHWTMKNMVYGDKPKTIREYEDPLGLTAYTYAPNINAIRQSSNLYVYCGNNPIMYKDSSGKFWDTLIDVGGFLLSAYDMITDPSWANAGWLLVDTAALIVPFVPGTGAVRAGARTLNAVDTATDITKTANRVDNVTDVARMGNANIGNKLDYVFGMATGRAHNIERSQSMAAELRRIGIHDTTTNRTMLQGHFNSVLNNTNNIIGTQARSYKVNGQTFSYTATIRESFLMGPNGGVKLLSEWDGSRLLTVIIKGGS